MNFISFTLVISCLIALAKQSNALNCYYCVSCTSSGTSKTCSSGETYCTKTTTTISGTTYTNRDCASTCTESKTSILNQSGETKCCTGNLCNSSVRERFNIFSFFILALNAVIIHKI
ncbi:unnamed protein product [Brachionus calyciflorus]|uniref:Snake toxin/toxin-like domain-containing protein n=1 Tax=Brachionus calyciflorus TaxID=104777 RepID=A0A813XHA2_9BILA|nr:unnamed protein product [Brachionus calyciflorus]